MPGADAAADVNTTMDTAAVVAPSSLSMRVIKESLTKKTKKKKKKKNKKKKKLHCAICRVVICAWRH